MTILDILVFIRDTKPASRLFKKEPLPWPEFREIYMQIHRLPFLTVKRIAGPRMAGFSFPVIALTFWLIYKKFLALPVCFLVIGGICAVFMAFLQALIEYYLISWASRPLIIEAFQISERNYGRRISLEGQVMMSIRYKFQLGAFMIGIFPLLLYGIVIQIGFGGWEQAGSVYWQLAAMTLAAGLAFSYIGSRLLAREMERPILHLYEMMDKVKSGDMNIQAKDLFADEFAKLISGFNHMLEGIKLQNARSEQLIESYFSTLAAALDARDPYTAGHSQRVAEYAVHIGMLARLPEQMMDELRKSALLHDIGKIGTRDAVLLKDGVLTEDEFHQIQQHPVQGEMILQRIEPVDAMAPILPGVRSHHERYDGLGYPDHLKGDEIPLFGRIIAVADAFDAMTSDRPYRKGMDTDTAIGILEKGRGTQWDPYFAGLFVEDYRQKRNND
ncbi:HD domain-containing phosphohydrolase [Paenibacillus yonginensis]|nr:HD domain-containing phosphohydrolase [Paenibacillus yonginensis]